MDIVLSGLLNRKCFDVEQVVFFSNDEIIINVSDLNYIEREEKVASIKENLKHFSIPLKVEHFKLHKIEGSHGYYKEIFQDKGKAEIKFKCVDSLYMPFVIRKFLGQGVEENDKVFYHNGLLAKFIDVPEIKLN